MKVGVITKPNQKGQIVIPKKMREVLGINDNVALNLILRGNGIYIYPVEEVVAKGERESSYLEILQKTQGTWRKEDWGTVRKKRRKIELTASKKRKQAW